MLTSHLSAAHISTPWNRVILAGDLGVYLKTARSVQIKHICSAALES